MLQNDPRHQRLILEALRTHRTMTMERLVTAVPDVSWNCLFQAIDELSRSGRITVYRRGFEYELSVSAGGQPSRSAA